MSQTFLYKGRRVDFDYWMLPDLSLDLDFDILASMVTGTSMSGVFENQTGSVTRRLQEELEFTEVTSSMQYASGAALVAAGVAVIAPGPMYAVAYAVGGPIGVLVYVGIGVLLIVGGSILMWTA